MNRLVITYRANSERNLEGQFDYTCEGTSEDNVSNRMTYKTDLHLLAASISGILIHSPFEECHYFISKPSTHFFKIPRCSILIYLRQ